MSENEILHSLSEYCTFRKVLNTAWIFTFGNCEIRVFLIAKHIAIDDSDSKSKLKYRFVYDYDQLSSISCVLELDTLFIRWKMDNPSIPTKNLIGCTRLYKDGQVEELSNYLR